MQVGVLLTLGILICSFLIAGIIGYKRSNTLTAFFLMDGRLNLSGLVGTLATTNFSLGNMIFLSLIWGYSFGFSGIFWLCIGFVIAASVYVWFVRQPMIAE